VTWGVDFTSRARADLVGLQPEVADTITDTLVDWVQNGRPRESIVDRYLVGYMVKDDSPAFVILWLRRQPGTSG
jgi:hypothetical protein